VQYIVHNFVYVFVGFHNLTIIFLYNENFKIFVKYVHGGQ